MANLEDELYKMGVIRSTKLAENKNPKGDDLTDVQGKKYGCSPNCRLGSLFM